MDNNYPALVSPSFVSGRSITGAPGAFIPGYASSRVGSQGIPGSSGPQPIERVRLKLLDLVYETWMVFTSTITSRFIGPRAPTANWQSPFDLDAGERITRHGSWPSGQRPFPYPYVIGTVSADMPLLDELSLSWAWGKTPSGPDVGTPIPLAWQISYPELPKVTG